MITKSALLVSDDGSHRGGVLAVGEYGVRVLARGARDFTIRRKFR